MSDNVLVIPVTVKVGPGFPKLLPLADGDLKPATECTRDDVGEAIAECRVMTKVSRERLEAAYRELSKNGVEFITPPAGAAPELGIANVVCCRDPDGFIVELVELVRAKRRS